MSVIKNKQPLRLLIVEDNPDIAENIADYLEAQGNILDFAMDGIGGLHLALTQDYDVIVLDIMLPRMDGLTFCRELREKGERRTPVLMLTAVNSSFPLGFNSSDIDDNWMPVETFLEKPVDFDVLTNNF